MNCKLNNYFYIFVRSLFLLNERMFLFVNMESLPSVCQINYRLLITVVKELLMESVAPVLFLLSGRSTHVEVD